VKLKMDKGWERMAKALDPKLFEAALRRHIPKATKLNGLLAVARMRQELRNGEFAKNAPLTVFIKGSDKPLVDGGDLFQGITMEQINDFTVFVGVRRTDRRYDIAKAIHEGATIRVTPAMRGMFFMLWRASEGQIEPSALEGRAAELWSRHPGGWKPLKATTTVIVIPGRPWTEHAFDDGVLKRQAQKNWEEAIAAALREVAAQGK
jgi:hypothetical protein